VIPYTQPAPYHSQWGEDRWLAEHVRLPERGVFVDVGAGDGARGSNTLYFEELGWTGLCVDPDPRNHEPLSCRRCIADQRAISSTPGRRQFGMYGPKSSWSGLERRGPGYIPITVECVRLDTLLAEAGIATIDLLSIDVEGTELDVWRSFDPAQHRPGVVIIEYDDTHPDRTPTAIQYALGSAYTLRHRTPANLIFLRGGR
jgi:FkbM family methyltransferase